LKALRQIGEDAAAIADALNNVLVVETFLVHVVACFGVIESLHVAHRSPTPE